MGNLEIRNLGKSYGLHKAVGEMNLSVTDGEFVTLLGPSGCGKSTTLNLIAGLDRGNAGRISMDGAVLFDWESRIFVPAEGRNFGMVFQSYALWPHMTVEANLTFPLKLRKLSGREMESRVGEALDLVEMDKYRKRYPHELSGGQQQRVALARTLVYRPSLLLLDEPFSNLDAKLRERARLWLSELRRRLKITTIFVTHDQEEALALSDRIVLMDKGEITQIGTPLDVYRRPANLFVAEFIGGGSIISGVVEPGSEEGRATIRITPNLAVTVRNTNRYEWRQNVAVLIRPEAISIVERRSGDCASNKDPGKNEGYGTIESRTYLGSKYEYIVSVDGVRIRAESPVCIETDAVTLVFDEDSIVAIS